MQISGFHELNLKQYNPNFEGNRGANVKLDADKRTNRQSIKVNSTELALIKKARNQITYEKSMGLRPEHKTLMAYMREAVMLQMERLINGEAPLRPKKDRSRSCEARSAEEMTEMFDQLAPVEDVAGLLNDVLGDLDFNEEVNA